MRTVSVRIEDLRKITIPIGYVGENLHTRVMIDAGKIFAQYPDAVATMTVRQPYGAAYPVVVTRDGDTVVWDVSDSDLTHEGVGGFQLAFTENGVVAHSCIGSVRVERSIVPTGETPEPIENWMEQAEAALSEIDGMTASAETLAAGSDATAEVSIVEGHKNIAFGIPKGEKGDAGAAGADGKDGKDGADGKNGTDGAPGQDGVSPIVTVTDITGGHRVTITDASGDHSFDVMDGSVPVSPKWEVIRAAKITNSTEENIEVTVDDNGQAFELTDVAVAFVLSAASGESASYGEYGRVRYYYGTNSYDETLSNAINISAGGSKRGFYTFVEQKDNMLIKNQTSQITTGDGGSIKEYVTDSRASALYPIVILTEQRVYTKIEFRAVKGIADFVIYGKRKQS